MAETISGYIPEEAKQQEVKVPTQETKKRGRGKEQKERGDLEELVNNAHKVLLDFVNLQPGEKVVLLKEGKTNKEMPEVLRKAAEAIGANFEEVIVNSKTEKVVIDDYLANSQVIIDMLDYAEGYDGTRDVYNDVVKSQARLIALFDMSADAFKNGSAMTETLEDMEYRANKIEALLHNAAGLRVTSRYGTDLEIGLRPYKDRRWAPALGKIDGPGKWDNLPGGEIFTTPDESKVNGVLVLPVPIMEKGHQGVDKFIHVKVRDGIIVSVQGGISAQEMVDNLSQSSAEDKEEGTNPYNPYRIAEIAFGLNSKAKETVVNLDPNSVPNPDELYRLPDPGAETEKRLGTIHLAFGGSQHGEEGSEGYENSIAHNDFVIPRFGLTVEVYYDQDDFAKKRNGKKIIDNGGLNFF